MELKVLENPEIRKLVSPLPVKNYHRMSKAGWISQKTELIEGVVVDNRVMQRII